MHPLNWQSSSSNSMYVPILEGVEVVHYSDSSVSHYSESENGKDV